MAMAMTWHGLGMTLAMQLTFVTIMLRKSPPPIDKITKTNDIK